MTIRKLVPLGFIVAATLFVVAAVVPAAQGRPFGAAYLTLSVVFAILAGVTWRKSSDRRTRPSA